MITPRISPGVLLVAFSLASPFAARAGWRIDPNYHPLLNDGFAVGFVTGVQPDGKILTDFGKERLLADGTIDPSFQPILTYTSPGPGQSSQSLIRSIDVAPSGQLIATQGSLTSYNDTDLVWLDPDGSTTTTKVSLTGGSTQLHFATNDQIVLIGYFTAVNGVHRAGLARLNADGSLDASFDAGTGTGGQYIPLYSLQPDGKILLGGIFTSFDGIARDQIVRLNLDGTVDPTFDAGPIDGSDYLEAVATEVNGTVLRANLGTVRRCDANGGSPTVIAQTTTGTGHGQITQMQPLPDGKLLLAGNFTAVNGTPAPPLVRLNSNGSLDTTFTLGFASQASPAFLRQSDGRLFVTSSTPTRTFRLLADGAIDPSFQPAAIVPGAITAVAPLSGNRTLIGGQFSSVDHTPRSTLAVLNADGSLDISFNPGLELGGFSGDPMATFPSQNEFYRSVTSLAEQPDGKMLVTGLFSRTGGIPRAGAARFLSTGAIDPTFEVTFNDGASINTVAPQADGHILIGGTFSEVDGSPRGNLARLNEDGSLDGSFAITTGITGQNATVNQIQIAADGHVYVAGNFDAYNGSRQWNVTRLNSDGSLDATFNTGSETAPDAILSVAETTAGGVAVVGADTVKAFTTDGAKSFSNQQLISPVYYALGSSVIADGQGGVVVSFADAPGSVFAAYGTTVRYQNDGTLDHNFALETNDGYVLSMARSADGAIVVGGNFMALDGLPISTLARLEPDPVATPPSRLANISTRGLVGSGDDVLIAGFVVSGTEPQRVLIRGVGPTLNKTFNIPGTVGHPTVKVLAGSNGATRSYLDYWYLPVSPPFLSTRVLNKSRLAGAFDLVEGDSRSTDIDFSAIYELVPGTYTATLSGLTPGTGLVEIYDINGISADRHIVNLSTRGKVTTAGGPLIGGFVIDRGTKRVLIRAVGPGLDQFNVSATLSDPRFDVVRSSDQSTVATNDNWQDGGQGAAIIAAETESGAFSFADGSADAATVLTLPIGAYTVLVSGVNNAEGIALVEIYELSGP